MANLSHKKISRYLGRAVLLNYLGRLGAVVLFLAFLFGMGVYLGGRWSFRSQPYGHPVTVFHATQILLAFFFLVFWAWPRLRRPQSSRGMAVQLEKADKSLHEALSSALEFASPDPVLENALEISAGILPGFFDDTHRRTTAKRRWRSIVPKSFWIAAVLCAGFALFWVNLVRFEPVTGADMWRAYKDNFLVDPYRPLHTLEVAPGFESILKGESIKIVATLNGPGDHAAAIRYSMAGFPQETAEMKAKALGLNVFEFEFENLQADLTYEIEAGPLASLQYSIEVQDPPELTSIQLVYHFPKFMNRTPDVRPTGQGTVTAPTGSTVELTTRWNQPMSELFFRLNEEEKVAMERRGDYWRGKFALKTTGRYVLSGTSEEGVPIREGLEFAIQSEEDLPPEIEWVWPKEDLDFSGNFPKGRIPLRYRVSDDHGIQSVHLYAGSPNRATKDYEIANLDGKAIEHSSTYRFDLKPWAKEPVVRVYMMVTDNHPGFPNRTPNETRRMYILPPGTFDENGSATDEASANTDPYELTAIELLHLLKTQKRQNVMNSESTMMVGSGLVKWYESQEKIVQTTTRVGLRASERARQARYGAPEAPAEESGGSGNDPEGVEDLPGRLQRVADRLIGEVAQVDALVQGDASNGDSAAHHQIRQLDTAKRDKMKRSTEEGVRAYDEIAAAFEELTGRKPPRPAEEVKKDDEEAEGEDDEEGEEGEEEEGEDGEDGEDDEFSVDEKEGDEEERARTIAEGPGNDGTGDEEVEGGGAMLPTNVYSPSAYSLDPDSVHTSDPRLRVLHKALAENMEGIEVEPYGDRAIPNEYKNAVAEYNRVLLGEE